MTFRHHFQFQSAQDLLRRLSAISADLASCLDSVVLELNKSEAIDLDPHLVRCAQNLAATQIAITQQILWLTRLIATNGEPVILDAQPQVPDNLARPLQTSWEPNVAPPVQELIGLDPSSGPVHQALPAIARPKIEPHSHSTQRLRRAAVIYAPPETSAASLPSARAPSFNTKTFTGRRAVAAAALLLIAGLWTVILNPTETMNLPPEPGDASTRADGSPPNPDTAQPQGKPQRRLGDTRLTSADEEPPHQAPVRHEKPNLPQPTFTTDPLKAPMIVVAPPPQQDEPAASEALPIEAEAQASAPAAISSPPPRPEKAEAPAKPEKSEAKTEPAAIASKSPAAEKPIEFKTTVKPAPEPVQKFAPVILVLRDGQAALQIYRDLQRRHQAVLGNKTAELRKFAGPDQTPWVQLLAVPSSSKEEAQSICQGLGAEGQTLGCKVVPY